MKFFALIIFSIASILLSACSTIEKKNSKSVILAGILDIPVVEGSKTPKDCKTEKLFSRKLFPYPIQQSSCVLVKPEKDDSVEGDDTRDWTSIYSDILVERGWHFVQPAGTHYFLERPIATTNCSEQLVFTWWPYAEFEAALSSLNTNNGADFDYVSFTFSYLENNTCGDERLYTP